ncbi:hypothetical protein QW71_24260 [Paenibacillus sp. IHB B 3415]|uniref:reverse transcriptase/maturase family protein n=1 Tax=Paenibacillus sp. IHB B 3415 TaxID=867080 RepID=UPI000574C692|nr:reverse transcriptase/maturase family protein [Paenibacillus sp. IHB B 3415]KHL93254.1 hypothetical protein QW71_24260 [Paenibacillus sp. IHB B 3415]
MDIKKWKDKNQKGRKYAHFDSKVSLDRVWNYISNPDKVKEHGFYPFIHYTLSFIKYNKSFGKKVKTREICYSAHLDRYIYQYYGFKLNQQYNLRVELDGINHSSIAYRDNLHKNNIHFAKAAIDFIKNSKSCYVIIGDFTKFFDSLDHTYLKKMLCNLLGVSKLPADYYAVFKNITKYSVWKLEHLLKTNGFENNVRGIQQLNKSKMVLSPVKFKELKKQNVKPNKNTYGIPQGSAISAVLSNIYMLEFDKKLNDYVTERSGLYMRYSDDFIIVLPKEDLGVFKTQYQFVNSVINLVPHVYLEPEKTQVFDYNNGKVKSCNEDVLINVENGKEIINYLGFTFDGEKVTLRDKTVSKYYYRLYRKLNTIVKNNGRTKTGKRISCKNVYLKYSIKGSSQDDGNFISYVKRAERVFDKEESVGLVRKRHMQKIRKQLNKIN